MSINTISYCDLSDSWSVRDAEINRIIRVVEDLGVPRYLITLKYRYSKPTGMAKFIYVADYPFFAAEEHGCAFLVRNCTKDEKRSVMRTELFKSSSHLMAEIEKELFGILKEITENY